MVAALFVNNPTGGCVESVLTLDTHLFPVRLFAAFLAPVRLVLVRLGIRLLLQSSVTSRATASLARHEARVL